MLGDVGVEMSEIVSVNLLISFKSYVNTDVGNIYIREYILYSRI
jgi:hypothetical protein